MSYRSRVLRSHTGAPDDDSMLERDVLLNLMAVFLVLIGAPAMITAARAAADGAPNPEKPAATIYIANDATLRLDDEYGTPSSLEDIATALEKTFEQEQPEGPIVLCLAQDVPPERLVHVLQRINTIPQAKTYLALQRPTETR